MGSSGINAVHGIPQINPINWFFLFLFFNLGFYIFIIKNNFFLEKLIIYKKNKFKKTNKFLFKL